MNNDELAVELTSDEGKVKTLYFDSLGVPSIGVGRNLRDRGLSDDEIAYLLKNDIAIVLADLDKNLPWWRMMTEARQRTLANMTFNLGITKLLKFSNTLAYMRAGDYDQAADGMMNSLWAKQVPNRATRLAKIMRAG
jgi:lysozyme